ncbi:MAG: DUF4065 domain-containing protein [Chloroflexi bacterium]|nr:DUF4065 domain-containing protein [Chloroflexota bacterium]
MTSIYRQKLINVVLFFAKETKHVNMTKLMKLLNFFEFEHFGQTGYPSIGLRYYAFEKGPAPKRFWLEVKDGVPPSDLKEKVAISIKDWGHGKKELEFIARINAQVDFSIFTPREKKILEKLAYIYKDATAKTMSDISHEDDMPWEITKREKGLNAEIDYLLVVDESSAIDREIAKENLQDHFIVLKAFDVEPVK